MPVTAKLSKLFYDRLGEQIADELMNWFNTVDATYRSDLREFNEMNFARFDAKLEQRLAELRASVDAKIDRLASQVNAKLDRVEAIEQFARLDARITGLEARVLALIAVETGALRELIERKLRDHERWTYATWAGLVAILVTVLLRT